MRRERKPLWGKQGLPSSGRKSARSGLGVWPRRRTLIAAMAALVLLPIEASDAGWLSDMFKGSSKPGKSPKQVASPKRATVAKRATPAKPAASPKPRHVKLAALGPVALSPSALKPVAPTCDPSKFRIVRGCGTYRRIGRRDQRPQRRRVPLQSCDLRGGSSRQLKADGFTETRLLLTEGKARRSLVRRVAAANDLQANLFLSIHHDSVPNKFLEDWEFEGKKSAFQRPLQRLFRLRLPQKSGLQDEPRLRRTGRQGNEGLRPALCPSNTASPSWAGTGTRC